MIQIRPSQLSDLDRLMEIFDHARKFMASVGNGNQWINGYTQRELIAKEISALQEKMEIDFLTDSIYKR